MHHYKRFKGGPLFFGGSPVIQGGMSQGEMTAMLERQALENDRMLANAGDEAIELQARLNEQDGQMQLLMEQQERQLEMDLTAAQKSLSAELDANDAVDQEDDLEADFDKLEAALATGLGRGIDPNDNVRPV